MPLLSRYAQRGKIRYFLERIPPESRILEIGSGGGWVGHYLRRRGHPYYTGLDLTAPADIIGDVRDWKALGLKPGSFDIIIAFEIVEHVDCWQACYDLLAEGAHPGEGGKMFVTTPLPHRDWILKILEHMKLNQARTSPHDHLVYLADVDLFPRRDVRIVAGLSQWAILTK